MIGLQIPPAVLEKETLQCSSKEGCSPSFNYLQWCLQCPFLTTVIGFKVWPVHHQNASFNISFPACALPQGNKSPAASNLPCHRALFCSAISWLITNIIKWLLQWLEGQEVWGREPQKGAKITRECVVPIQKRTSSLLRQDRHWLDHSSSLWIFS